MNWEEFFIKDKDGNVIGAKFERKLGHQYNEWGCYSICAGCVKDFTVNMIKNTIYTNEKMKIYPPLEIEKLNKRHRVYKLLEANPIKIGTDLETTNGENDLSVSSCDCEHPENHANPIPY